MSELTIADIWDALLASELEKIALQVPDKAASAAIKRNLSVYKSRQIAKDPSIEEVIDSAQLNYTEEENKGGIKLTIALVQPVPKTRTFAAIFIEEDDFNG